MYTCLLCACNNPLSYCKQGRAAEELNYHDFAFRILPMLNYRQLNELDLAEKSDAIGDVPRNV